MTPGERCETALVELDEFLDELLSRYEVNLYVDDDGSLYLVPAEDDFEELIFEPEPYLH